MKKLAVLLIAISSLLTGCVVYDAPYRGGNDHSRDSGPGRGDRDHDGVPDRHDNRPNNPNRY